MNPEVIDRVEICPLDIDSPLKWIWQGWLDFQRAPAIGLCHGGIIALSGLLMLLLFYDNFWFLAALCTGFLAVAPVVAVGLYAVSQALEQQRAVSFKLVLDTWWSWRGHPTHDWRLIRFGLLLCWSGAGWVLTSVAFFTLFSDRPIHQPLDFIRYVLLSNDNHLFEFWWALGVAMAAPVFASTVITLPLLLERKIAILDAVVISWKVILHNPIPMVCWAILLFIGTMLGAILVVGCLISVPVLGHASWHAYRASVNADKLPLRVPANASVP